MGKLVAKTFNSNTALKTKYAKEAKYINQKNSQTHGSDKKLCFLHYWIVKLLTKA